ncbi:hypothetical protein F0562_010982 [Nyssa sinensis]|uniref:BHLH domain-containing protein n=1 Tax=Nyssa sinensis TaxID=561372 RepID=A0A5J5A2M6_9ASTE|nr:hypothetical protein F0562_010982 [Nyssa sinensis]
MLVGEGSGHFSPALSVSQTTDDTSIDSMHSGMNIVQSLFPSLDYAFGTLVNNLLSALMNSNQNQKSIDFVGEKLKMPKQEPFSNDEINLSTEPFNFISKSSDPISNPCDSSFLQLPDLYSLEQVGDSFAFGESSRKRVKSFSPSDDTYAFESILRNFQLSSYFAKHKPPEIQTPPVVPQSSVARQRRQRISERTRCLQKLLPWDKKMDMATMLEEAYKYIKFLQAQISVLQSMPSDSSSFSDSKP